MPKHIFKNEADWIIGRRRFGGSSEAAALFDRGYENMPSAWSLWALKSGKLPSADYAADDQRIRIGKRMEAVIAAEVQHVTGWDIIDNTTGDERVYYTHPDASLRMGSTVDRFVMEHEDGLGIIECKNRDYLQWVNSYTDDDASIRDRIQLAHQFACQPEIQWGMVAVIVGGNDLKRYVYKRAALADMIADVEAAWRWFWGLVEAGQEPELTGKELPGWLQAHDVAMAGTAQLEPIRLDADGVLGFDDIVATYVSADALAKAKAKEAKDSQAKIIQALAERAGGRSNRYRIKATYSQIAARMITLPLELKAACLWAANAMKGLDTGTPTPDWPGADEMVKRLEQAATWEVEAMKAHVRTSLNIDYDPMDVQGLQAASGTPSNGAARGPQPSNAELQKRAQDFQAPLDGQA